MSLEELLREQASINFTGRINVLVESSRQFVGVGLMSEGLVVGASLGEKKGIGALMTLFSDCLQGRDKFSFVIEPELIQEEDTSFEMTVDEVFERVDSLKKKLENSHSLRPPGGIKMVLLGGFIKQGPIIEKEEFEVMTLLTEYNKVSEIYLNSSFSEYLITSALVGLRKKGALRVIKNRG